MLFSRKTGTFQIKRINTVRLLSVHCDNKSTFEYHIPEISEKNQYKITYISKSAPFLSFLKRLILINSLFQLAFQLLLSYMDVSLGALINWKINGLHGRCFHIINIDGESPFEESLERESLVSIQDSNFNTKMFQVSKGLSHCQMHEILNQENTILTIKASIAHFSRPLVRSVYYGTESVSSPYSLFWEIHCTKNEVFH